MVAKENDWDYEVTEESEEEEQDNISYEISYFPSDLTLKGYLDKWDSKQLYLPEFQRSYVWDQVQASKLIESFLIGLPVPGVFLYKERKTNKLQIIDGQQRIVSAIRFFQGTFGENKFRLKNVHKKWNGKSFEELDEGDRYQLQDSVLRATVVQQLDPEDDSSIYHIFERLNTGGVNLNPMEVRKCVYFGPIFSMIEELNLNADWRKLIGNQIADKRLRDAELVLRVLALADSVERYEKPMKGFMNAYLKQFRRMKDADVQSAVNSISDRFLTTCSVLAGGVRERPFHLRNRLNYAVLDSTMATVMGCGLKDSNKIGARFENLLKDQVYVEKCSKSTSDTTVLKERFGIARKYLAGH